MSWPETANCFSVLWIGLRENVNRKAPHLMVKTLVSCKCSLKPIQWWINLDYELVDNPPAIYEYDMNHG